MHVTPYADTRISSRFAIATRYDRKPLEVLDWHEHRNLSFCFVMKGSYQETTRRHTFTCRTGDVVLKPGNLRHQNKFSHLGAVCLLLEISEESLVPSTGLIERELNGPIDDYRLARIGLELREELQVTDSLSAIMLEAIALRTVVSGLRLARERSKKQAQMEAMRESLDAGLGHGDLTAPCLTASERKSARRLFYEMEGCSMSSYILRRRAFRAFAELLNTDHSLADIAIGCGFYDQAHFTKVFAALFGVTPGRLRSRMS
jgi:AraC family transcriptional regulator